MEDQSFGFILESNNNYCEVICDEGHFMVFFNGKHQCEVEMNETLEWIVCDGTVMTNDDIQDIGNKIGLYLM